MAVGTQLTEIGLRWLTSGTSSSIEELKPRQNRIFDRIDRRRQDPIRRDLVWMSLQAFFQPTPPRKAQFGIDVNDRDTRFYSRHKILIRRPGTAVQRKWQAGPLLDLPDALYIEPLLSLATHHRGQETVHVSDGRCQNVDPGFGGELCRFIRSCKRQRLRSLGNNFGRSTDESYFPFNEDLGTYRFQRLDCLFCLFDILLEWPIRKVKDDLIKTCSRRSFSLLDRVRVIGVEKNRLPRFSSNPLYQGCDQANANEIPFTLGDAHEHGDIKLPSRRDYRFESYQVRYVEMTQRDMPLIRIFEKIA